MTLSLVHFDGNRPIISVPFQQYLSPYGVESGLFRKKTKIILDRLCEEIIGNEKHSVFEKKVRRFFTTRRDQITFAERSILLSVCAEKLYWRINEEKKIAKKDQRSLQSLFDACATHLVFNLEKTARVSPNIAVFLSHQICCRLTHHKQDLSMAGLCKAVGEIGLSAAVDGDSDSRRPGSSCHKNMKEIVNILKALPSRRRPVLSFSSPLRLAHDSVIFPNVQKDKFFRRAEC